MSQDRTTEILALSRSFSGDGFITTSYRDDNIVRGKIFSYGLIVTGVAGTPIYFTSEQGTLEDDSGLFLLPIVANPTTGYVQFNLYEDTEYTGGTQILATNRNRVSSITQRDVVKSGATGTVKGALLSFSDIFGVDSTNQNAGGGRGVSSDSILLDPTKKYLYEFIPSESGLLSIVAEFGEL